MKLLKNLFAGVFSMALLAVLGAGIYYGFQYTAGLFSGLAPYVNETMVTLWGAVLISALIIGGSIRWVYKRKAKEQLRFEKAQVYQQCLEVLAIKLQAAANPVNGSLAQLEAAERALLVWGSTGVVRKYTDCVAVVARKDSPSSSVRDAVGKLLKTIRVDLGETIFGLEEREMATLWLSTIRENARPVTAA